LVLGWEGGSCKRLLSGVVSNSSFPLQFSVNPATSAIITNEGRTFNPAQSAGRLLPHHFRVMLCLL